jgi:enoyl-CoA hydratase/carnithine racemase
MAEVKEFKTVKVEKEDGIAWVILNRPGEAQRDESAASLRHAGSAYGAGGG